MTDYGHYSGEPNPRTMLVEGPFGAGKTTFAVETLFTWLEAGIPAEKILVMVPQRTLAERYYQALRDTTRGPLGDVQVRTLNGLAKDTVNLYWPLVAEEAGFNQPDRPPRFLTIETAQYAMAEFVQEAFERGEFDAINASPQQIARQVIDNLGKAALLQIDYHEVPNLLAAAWGPERPRKRVLAYQAAGRVAEAFRQRCLEHRLLDYSLQIELFTRLLRQPDFRQQFFQGWSHLIVDHIEEETALTHDLLRDWLQQLDGALLIYEWWSGYRVFLGADPEGALDFRQQVEGVLTLDRSYITHTGLDALIDEVGLVLDHGNPQPVPADTELAFDYAFHRFYPEMLDWVARTIAHLVQDEGIPAHEIAVLAPFLSDSLRFSLGQKLAAFGVPHISHRPSRALRDEPAARTLLTLTALAYPAINYAPPAADVAQALHLAIDGLDPVRAGLLASIIYRATSDPPLTEFERINAQMQNRITYGVGQAYETLRQWIVAQREAPAQPLDHTFRLLFGEVLSQPGFGFHANFDAGRVVYELVESAQKFRMGLFGDLNIAHDTIAQRYFDIVNQGLLGALYVSSWREEQADAVFMAPAYTFLLRNRPVQVQFWLDVGSTGWWERLDQPLTHPYVLSPRWPQGQLWTDSDEYERQQTMLYRIVTGLVRRCRRHVYLGISDLGEQGYEQRGPLLRVFQQILRHHPKAGEVAL